MYATTIHEFVASNWIGYWLWAPSDKNKETNLKQASPNVSSITNTGNNDTMSIPKLSLHQKSQTNSHTNTNNTLNTNSDKNSKVQSLQQQQQQNKTKKNKNKNKTKTNQQSFVKEKKIKLYLSLTVTMIILGLLMSIDSCFLLNSLIFPNISWFIDTNLCRFSVSSLGGLYVIQKCCMYLLFIYRLQHHFQNTIFGTKKNKTFHVCVFLGKRKPNKQHKKMKKRNVFLHVCQAYCKK